MSTEASAENAAAQVAAPAAAARTQTYLWSVRREIWENRALWIAPLTAAGVVLFGYTISLFHRMRGLDKISHAPPELQAAFHLLPYGIATAAILLTASIVALFYCLGALYNERRDRSILFWKSMPVSDATTVLAKASVPLIVLPVIAFAVVCAVQLVMLGLSAGAAFAGAAGSTPFWGAVPLPRIWALVVYAIVVLTLWYAPLYGWLLVISAWARRGPFLWAILPPIAAAVIEKLAFDTHYSSDFVKYRLHGGLSEAFVSMPHHGHSDFHWPEPDPARFFSSPGLWLGLLAAAALIALAIWLRRRREPM